MRKICDLRGFYTVGGISYRKSEKNAAERKKMANALQEQIIKVLNEAGNEIRANMDAKRINASGRTSASIRIHVSKGSVQLVGGTNTKHPVPDYPRIKGTAEAPDTAPIPTLEVGRVGGGNPPVPRGFYYVIREWSRAKGLSFTSEQERSTFAFFLSRKIAREGTDRSRNHIDVYSTPAKNARDRIEKIIKDNVANTVRGALSRANVQTLQGAFTD